MILALNWPSFGFGVLTGVVATIAIVAGLISLAMHTSGEMDSGGREP